MHSTLLRLLRALFLGLALLIQTSIVFAQPSSASLSLDQIKAGLLAQIQSLKQLRVQYDWITLSPRTGKTESMSHVDWATKNGMVYFHVFPQGNSGMEDYEIFKNGQRHMLSPIQTKTHVAYYDHVVYQQQKSEVPSPLDCYRLNGEWIGMLVQRYPFRVVQTTHDPEFGLLYEIEGKIEPSQELVRFWLAPGWNYMAVRVEDQILSHPSIEIVYSCTKAERQAGQCVPTRCSMLEGTLKHGKLEASSLWEFKNITYSFNNVPDSLFSPQLPAGSILYDENKQQMCHITPSGTLPDARFGHVQSRHYLLAWLFIGSLTALVLILSGIFIGWRRRQRGA